ncbi:hypothetical protein BKA62DRAFT_835584 [Auriculariales sp. MPI-PUGE-AT-0066]|nr:hypothetical protein BKA62DRAFT_835584 [Auriculariales sp. MPI-PUGE-AT-0066]
MSVQQSVTAHGSGNRDAASPAPAPATAERGHLFLADAYELPAAETMPLAPTTLTCTLSPLATTPMLTPTHTRRLRAAAIIMRVELRAAAAAESRLRLDATSECPCSLVLPESTTLFTSYPSSSSSAAGQLPRQQPRLAGPVQPDFELHLREQQHGQHRVRLGRVPILPIQLHRPALDRPARPARHLAAQLQSPDARAARYRHVFCSKRTAVAAVASE